MARDRVRDAHDGIRLAFEGRSRLSQGSASYSA
jgi:hypothetical protein